MNKDEALKMAIEYCEGNEASYYKQEIADICKEALEQPAQEPDRTGMVYYKNNACKAKDAKSHDCICWTPKQPAQEPVLPFQRWSKEGEIINQEGFDKLNSTHPHQWQRLTDDEIKQCGKGLSENWVIDFAHAIEAKLKEKNTSQGVLIKNTL
jgi:hypothetical protein